MDIISLRCFVALADTERFTAAAELLFMSQPSFSRRIKELEAELGVPLVERTTRNMRLTEAGKITYYHAKNVLLEVQRLKDELGIPGTTEAPAVTICYPSLMLNWIGGLFSYLKEKIPNLTINYYLADKDTSDSMQRLMAGRCDFMFFPEHRLNQLQGVQYLPLIKSPYCAVLSSDSKMAAKEHIAMEELRELTLLSFGTVGVQDMERDMLAVLQKNGCYPQKIEYVFNLDEMELKIAMGGGYAILPEFLKNYASAKVRYVPIQDFPINGDRVCIWKSDNRNPVLYRVIREISNWRDQIISREI